MAEEFKLSPEEAVILRTGKIGYGGGFQLPSMFNSNELILTNKNLILLRKNMFGQTEDTLYFPLSKILMANGRPQVKKSNPSHMEYALDVYFETGMESFRFEWERDIDEWVENIVSVVTGNGLKDVNNAIRAAGEPMSIRPDMDHLLEAFENRGIRL